MKIRLQHRWPRSFSRLLDYCGFSGRILQIFEHKTLCTGYEVRFRGELCPIHYFTIKVEDLHHSPRQARLS